MMDASDGLFGSEDRPEFEEAVEYGVSGGKDGRLFEVPVSFRGERRVVGVEISQTAESMLAVDVEIALRERIEWELNSLPNDVDWTDAIGGAPMQFHSKHVEGGIGDGSRS